MWKQLRSSLFMLLILTAVTGIIYPLAMTGFAQFVFPEQANGSLVYKDGTVVGSKLIGQNFDEKGYFQSRPSAAGDDGYDGTASGATNLGPTSNKLLTTVKDNVEKIRTQNNLFKEQQVPADLVTASASGLDPHISPEAAYLQVKRVASERNLAEEKVRALVERHIEQKQFGILGEPRVNVLLLNQDLDRL